MEPNDVELPSAALLRRNRGYLGMGLAPWGLALGLGLAALALKTEAFLFATPHLAIIGALTFLHVLQKNPGAEPLPGGVRVDAEGVHAGGRLVARRAELRQGLVTPGEEGARVVLQRHGLRLATTLQVPDVPTGDRLLAALGLGASQRAARVRVLGGYADWSMARQLAVFLLPTLLALAVAVPLTLAVGHPAALLAILLPVVAAVAGTALAPRSLDIGAEGLHLRWLGRDELIRFDDVADLSFGDVRRGGKEFRVMDLALRSGGVRSVMLAQKGFADHLVGAIEVRVGAAFESFRGRPDMALGQVSKALGRGDADVGAWLTRLRRLGAGGAAGPREAAVPREHLVRIVEDPGQEDEDRAAAAVALRADAAPDVLERVRIAAETAASPRLRIALERAADERAEDAAIEEALAATSTESTTSRRGG